jgi:hypothetical protein
MLDRGRTIAMAGEMCMDLSPRQANTWSQTLDAHGGPTPEAVERWVQYEGMKLIDAGRCPTGRMAHADCASTAFFVMLAHGWHKVGLWCSEHENRHLDRIALDRALAMLDPARQHGMEYLLGTRAILMRYPQ